MLANQHKNCLLSRYVENEETKHVLVISITIHQMGIKVGVQSPLIDEFDNNFGI
jgi:hypothetical protein